MDPNTIRRLVRIAGAIFRLRLELSDLPEGKYLGQVDLPGSAVRFLNIELLIVGLRALLGHVRLY